MDYKLDMESLRFTVSITPVRDRDGIEKQCIIVGYKVDSYEKEWAGETKRENLKALREKQKAEAENKKD